jgi:hypothetical protein
MTVRMTQTKAGITKPSTSPYPARQTGHPDLSELAGTEVAGRVTEAGPTEPGVVVSVDPVDIGTGPVPDSATDRPPAPDHASRTEGLRAVRAERHRRRVLSVACAALVAACLVVTILIVGLARTRSSGHGAARPPSALTAAGRAPTVSPVLTGPFVPIHQSTQIRAPRRR